MIQQKLTYLYPIRKINFKVTSWYYFSNKIRKRIYQTRWRSNRLRTCNWYWKDSRLCTPDRSIQCIWSFPILLSSLWLCRRSWHYLCCYKEKWCKGKSNQGKGWKLEIKLIYTWSLKNNCFVSLVVLNTQLKLKLFAFFV